MRRQLLIPLLVALLIQVTDLAGQPDEKQPQAKDVLAILKLSLKDLDELKEVEITGATVHPNKMIELSGRIPNAGVKPKLQMSAEAALENAFKAKYKVDVSALVDMSVPAEKRLIDLLNARLFGPGKPLQGKVSEATVKGDVVVLKGTVLAEGMKAVLETEGKKLLDEAVRVKNLPGPYARIDTSALRRLPNELFGVLQSSLADSPDLAGFKLIYAELTPEGVLRLAGLIAQEEQRAALKRRTIEVVKNAVAAGNLPMAPMLTELDLSKVRVGSSSSDELLVVESLLPTQPIRVVRGQQYDPASGELYLTGIVESEASRDRVTEFLQRLPLLRKVDTSNVLVRQSSGLEPGQPTGTLLSAQDALGRCDRTAMLESATASVRNAAPNSTSAVNSWYLRAAAHLMLGKRQAALGDLRVAHALAEQVVGGSGYYSTLERFQGPMRIELSKLLREGARGAIVMAE